jgi:KUP system potassium uptake protein
MLRKVIQDLVTNNEVNITSRYESLEKNNVVGDFQFVILEKYLSQDNELPFFERIIMKLHFWLKEASLNEERGFGLDPSFVTVEKFPLMVSQIHQISLHRVFDEFASE